MTTCVRACGFPVTLLSPKLLGSVGTQVLESWGEGAVRGHLEHDLFLPTSFPSSAPRVCGAVESVLNGGRKSHETIPMVLGEPGL